MPWKELFTQSRIRTEIVPVIKDDYYKIMSEGVKLFVNADPKLKEILLLYLKPYAFNAYKSEQSYKWASIIPATFIQWLSERRKRQITLSDLETPNLMPEDAALFVEDYSSSTFVQAHVRANLIKFFNFLINPARRYITTQPLGDMTTDMPISVRAIVYNKDALDEFYDGILFGAPTYYTLFFKLLLQTGLRPKHAHYLTCGAIEVNKPQKDALGRVFYPIPIREHIAREKRKVREEIAKKFPPEFVYISESLKNEIMKWCKDNKLGSDGYVFKDFFILDAAGTFIERRRKSPSIAARLKQKPDQYMLYGLRHTWASVMFAITKNVGDLIDYGGWRGQGIPLNVYRQSMPSEDALEIAKKWELYIPPDRKLEVEHLQGMIERGEARPAAPSPGLGQEEIDKLFALVNDLTSEVNRLKKAEEEREAVKKALKG